MIPPTKLPQRCVWVSIIITVAAVGICIVIPPTKLPQRSVWDSIIITAAAVSICIVSTIGCYQKSWNTTKVMAVF